MNFHPVDRIRDRFQNIAAHPFQTAMRMGAGALGGPAGSALAGALFGAYNRRQDANAAQSIANRTVQQGNAAAQSGFDRPLSGALGAVAGGGAGDNRALAGAMLGGPGGSYGGTADARNGAYNMAQQWQNSHPSMGQLFAGMPGSQQSMTPQGTFFTDPQYDQSGDGSGKLRESRENDTRSMPGFALNGVSNFMVGGMPVINGSRGYGAFGGSGQGYFKGRTPGR